MKTIKRPAKAGERILIVNPKFTGGKYEKGAILHVREEDVLHRGAHCFGIESEHNESGFVLYEEYEVIVEEPATVPVSISILTERIRNWAIDRNLNNADPTKQAIKLGEEFGELCAGLARSDDALIEDSLGDMYVVMTILAQQKGLDIGACIESAYNEIKDRKGRMVDGVFVKELDLAEGAD